LARYTDGFSVFFLFPWNFFFSGVDYSQVELGGGGGCVAADPPPHPPPPTFSLGLVSPSLLSVDLPANQTEVAAVFFPVTPFGSPVFFESNLLFPHFESFFFGGFPSLGPVPPNERPVDTPAATPRFFLSTLIPLPHVTAFSRFPSKRFQI